MTNPIDQLNITLTEIAEQLKHAYRCNLGKEEIELMVDHYNRYYMAIQLLSSHLEIPYNFAKLKVYEKSGHLGVKYCNIKKHKSALDQLEKRNNIVTYI